MASQFDHLDTIDILTVEDSLFENTGLRLKKELGVTPYEQFAERHWDVEDLTYSSLGTMANVIIEEINREHKTRFTKKKLIEIIQKGIDSNKISRDRLKNGVEKHLN